MYDFILRVKLSVAVRTQHHKPAYTTGQRVRALNLVDLLDKEYLCSLWTGDISAAERVAEAVIETLDMEIGLEKTLECSVSEILVDSYLRAVSAAASAKPL